MGRGASHTTDWALGVMDSVPPLAQTTPGRCSKEVAPLDLEK